MPVIDLGSVVGPQGQQGVAGATGAQGIQGNPGPNQVTDQTSTNLNGVLFGNQSRVTVKPVDSTPTADSTNLVSSGGTYDAIKGRVPVNGMGKNLLDNWYFGNPVNQRGLATYPSVNSGGRYTIDRWFTNSWYISVSVSNDGVAITNNHSAAQADCFHQSISVSPGMYTLSVVLSDGSFYTRTQSIQSSSVGITLAITNTASLVASTTTVRLILGAGEGLTIQAVKLELGTEQTLCHNEGTDANPVWVLNEIPDYEYELYKCITSTADPSDTYANKTIATGEELAYVESGTTASRAYAVGEYFCWHGLLYRATSAISSGGTFTENTNCEVVTGGGINDLFRKKATVLSGTTGASSETLTISAGRFLIILATRGDTSFTFAVVYRYNNWKLEGTNTAGVTVDASTGQITLLNYTHYKIIY